jgi:hypothetical protein
MANLDNNELVEFLSTHSIANVQNGLISALAIWLDEHVQGEAIENRKRQVFYGFTASIRNVVKQYDATRKVWPKNRPLPYPYNEIKVIDFISDRVLQRMKGMRFVQGLTFLTELWGGWILICPREIIQNSPEFASEMVLGKTETELTETMIQYVELVYGTM